jgi:hypothetical protein
MTAAVMHTALAGADSGTLHAVKSFTSFDCSKVDVWWLIAMIGLQAVVQVRKPL